MKITLDPFDDASIDRAIKQLQSYQKSLKSKGKEICKRLAKYGADLAMVDYSKVAYVGEKDVFVSVEETEKGYRILADGETVLILEFGAGVTYGYGHEQAGEFGMGPGTYPGQKHAMDPKGWHLPKDKGGAHTYGNAPSMAMYNAARSLRERVEQVAREVFAE